MCDYTIYYKGVDISKATKILSYKSYISLLYQMVFGNLYYKDITKNGPSSSVNMIYTFEDAMRADYDEIFNTLLAVLRKKSLDVNFIKLHRKFQFVFSFRIACHFFSVLFSKYTDLGKGRIKNSLLIALARANVDQVTYYFNSSNQIVVTFCDAHFEDSIITQVSRNQSCTTVTLQHGQYHIINDDVPENHALESLSSDYLLAWGRATKEEYDSKIGGETQIVPLGICANSLVRGSDHRYSNINFSDVDIVVLLNADNCLKKNLDMINLIGDYCSNNGIYFSVKFHPRNVKRNYTNLLDSIDSFRKDVGSSSNTVFIVYTSGVLVKLLGQCKKLLLYSDIDTPSIYSDHIPNFRSQKELAQLINSIGSDSYRYAERMNRAKEFFIESDDIYISYGNFFSKIIRG
ncbi:hypothetical protein FCV59_20560 [Vibrio sp. F13]|uniref:hypothetical protein n=1 Tax=Vibrio sp. F13 TaxID=2070777 RepID=UPI0010BD0ADD|nr:hypothetical protein [Vibrio sp. F13]TKF69496.1 hypothetical protein FCV59_20560 [Vibrio sp. F13]